MSAQESIREQAYHHTGQAVMLFSGMAACVWGGVLLAMNVATPLAPICGAIWGVLGGVFMGKPFYQKAKAAYQEINVLDKMPPERGNGSVFEMSRQLARAVVSGAFVGLCLATGMTSFVLFPVFPGWVAPIFMAGIGMAYGGASLHSGLKALCAESRQAACCLPVVEKTKEAYEDLREKVQTYQKVYASSKGRRQIKEPLQSPAQPVYCKKMEHLKYAKEIGKHELAYARHLPQGSGITRV